MVTRQAFPSPSDRKTAYRIGALIDALVAVVTGAIGANRPRMRFTPRLRGGSTSSHEPSIAETRTRRKFERHNRHFAQRCLRACA